MKRFSHRPLLWAFALAAFGAVISPASAMQIDPRAARAADDAARATLAAARYRRTPGELGIAAVVARRPDVRDIGELPADAPVHVSLLLRYRNESELQTLVMEQGDRRSPLYHHYLSTKQWLAYFAPNEETYRRTMNVLIRRGFRIERTTPNRALILATGTKTVAERMFRTHIHAMYQNKYGLRYGNVVPAVMPAELRESVFSVAGLHDVVLMDVPHHETAARAGQNAGAGAPRPARGVRRPDDVDPTATPSPAPSPFNSSTPPANPSPESPLPTALTDYKNAYGYGPVAFSIAYDFPAQHGYDGGGQNVGNVISGDFLNSDLAAYLTQFGITRGGTTTRVLPADGEAPSDDSDSNDEATLDAEVIIGQDPDVNFYEYQTPPLEDENIEIAYNKVVSDNIVDEASSSFGGCEIYDPTGEYSYDYIALQGNAEGIGFNASTGDTGSNGCYATPAGNLAPGELPGVSAPSAGLHFAAIGGTDLFVNPATAAYIKENGWNGSNGGVSQFVPLPDWQAAAVMAGTSPLTTGRNTPDVAFNAALDTSFDEYDGGSNGPQGGTSEASPMFCAMIVEIDQVQQSRNGWVNPRLYQIQQGQGYGYAMRDVIGGSNVGYVATPGYDNVTGIGSLIGFELASEL